ncbi:mitochondrial-processing peptidase subunit alpha-like [Cucurbita pepo subsp. pepo]|uniref:mitochondrial-processing peptidase subunit alpha-like n=1 Tax=Cucurbita pepo subsp. pepo TaxID=3664 RepID=UPI000C9D30CB|nr:mitochondrial-processing peptidase subunit alpha-like [Cucurbita pepo subsp. pepo]
MVVRYVSNLRVFARGRFGCNKNCLSNPTCRVIEVRTCQHTASQFPVLHSREFLNFGHICHLALNYQALCRDTVFDHHVQSCSFTNQVSNDLPALVLLPQKYKSSGGLFGWLLRDRSISSPLDFPLSDVNLPSPLPDYVEPTPESAIDSLSGTVLEKFVDHLALNTSSSYPLLNHFYLTFEVFLVRCQNQCTMGAIIVIKDGRTHFALAFELPGGWHKEKDAMASTVLQMLLGGGGSFSAGGPRKGMSSRLWRWRVFFSWWTWKGDELSVVITVLILMVELLG